MFDILMYVIIFGLICFCFDIVTGIAFLFGGVVALLLYVLENGGE